ncbi:MAG: hypothetical protein QOD93_5758, partial [Acetobacteraceae bacterium]|nr:hypothetical protein [Acetobacteraceae bacterium]
LVTSGDAASAAEKAGGMRVDGPLLVKPYQYEIVLKRIEGLLGQAKRSVQDREPKRLVTAGRRYAESAFDPLRTFGTRAIASRVWLA